MSFRLKTILGIAFIEAMLLLALVIISLAYLRDSNELELQRRATMAATLFATATNDAVLSTDLARLEQLSIDFLKNPGVVYVRIFDKERLLVEEGFTQSVLKRPFHADSTLDLVDDGIYDTFTTIQAAGQNFGRIELGLSIDSIQALIDEARRLTVGLAALEMVLVALFSWLLGNYLTRQLADLEAASNRIAQGDFSPQLAVRGKDELARVAHAFNSMSERMGKLYRNLQRVLAEAKQRGERLQAVVDSGLDGLIAIDRTGSITLFSRAAEQIFGYQSKEVTGRNVKMLMPEPYRSNHDLYLQNYFATGQQHIIGISREVQGQRKNGEIFAMDLSISELHSAEQPGFLGLVRDITERKKIDEQLQASANMKKAMLESSLDAIITIDKRSRIYEFNQSASATFGYQLEEVKGKSMVELLMPERYRVLHNQGLEHYMQTGEAAVFGRRFEISALRRTGEEFPIELAITPIQHEGDLYFTAFLRDISETKAAETALRQGREQAEHASIIKSQFLAMMSHEIRTPLNAILGTQELLAETDLDEIQKNHLKLGMDAGGSLLNLINDILDLTKVEAGKLELEHFVFDAVKVVNEVLQLVEAKAQEKNLLLISVVPPDISPWISGDPWRLRQVLLNLLTNAIKFTPNGMITVKLSQQPATATDGALLFEVTDTGIGIAEEVQPRLFELFIQADPSDTRKYGGSGLGLAISKRLVELCGGHMGLDSRIGIGSRFWFSFGDAAHQPMEVPSGRSIQGNPVRTPVPAKILLVEDSLTNQAVLSALLRSGGHLVDVADSGGAAILKVQENHYDIIFMDVSMPDMDGMEATRCIRQLGGEASTVPIIAMTAHAVKGYKELCMAAGMNDYATKPIRKRDLLALVDEWRSDVCAEPELDPVSSTEAGLPVENSLLLDEDVLLQMAKDSGMEDVSELLGIFMAELQIRMAAITSAVALQDLSALGREAHTLKSGAATFGAWPLHTLSVELDKYCKQGDLDAASDVSVRLVACGRATLAAIAEHCGNGAL
ncbi:MAG: PAS domain S-box protein [Methylococcales bacterium]|nr:PAS domain S-box protein [Methylococcales bacterium]